MRIPVPGILQDPALPPFLTDLVRRAIDGTVVPCLVIVTPTGPQLVIGGAASKMGSAQGQLSVVTPANFDKLATFWSNVLVQQNISISGRAQVAMDLAAGSLIVAGQATVGGLAINSGVLTLGNKNLVVLNAPTTSKTLTQPPNYFDGDALFRGNILTQKNLNVSGDATVSKSLAAGVVMTPRIVGIPMPTTQVITAASSTYRLPAQRPLYIRVTCIGGGGGGSSTGNGFGGGGGGGTAIKRILASNIIAGITCTVGGGGGTGTIGSDTTFGSYVTAKGGGTGVGQAPGTGGGLAGGQVGDIVFPGSGGDFGFTLSGVGNWNGGGGGTSMAGHATGSGVVGGTTAAGYSYGGGGGGGQSGANGVIIVEEFYQ